VYKGPDLAAKITSDQLEKPMIIHPEVKDSLAGKIARRFCSSRAISRTSLSLRAIFLWFIWLALSATSICQTNSVYPQRPDDAHAIYVTPEEFHVVGDGKADDSDAIQTAIDRAQETHGEGIVFLASGRYRLSRTIFLWPGVRLIGYGVTRPVLMLNDNTPGYQHGIAYMVFFAGARPRLVSANNGRLPSSPEVLFRRAVS
jgi:Pectate lyase superfamily protein